MMTTTTYLHLWRQLLHVQPLEQFFHRLEDLDKRVQARVQRSKLANESPSRRQKLHFGLSLVIVVRIGGEERREVGCRKRVEALGFGELQGKNAVGVEVGERVGTRKGRRGERMRTEDQNGLCKEVENFWHETLRESLVLERSQE